MPIVLIHRGLANSASLFLAFLAIWATCAVFRARHSAAPGTALQSVAEILLVAQFVVGGILWLQGLQAGPRPWIHVLYGAVAIITLPAAYSYFGKLEDGKVQALAMTLACAFLWGIVQRAGQVITLQVPY